MLYKIIDNFTGETRETNNHEQYKNIIRELKENYTKKETYNDTTREEPFYIITTHNFFENKKMYCITYFDIKK